MAPLTTAPAGTPSSQPAAAGGEKSPTNVRQSREGQESRSVEVAPLKADQLSRQLDVGTTDVMNRLNGSTAAVAALGPNMFGPGLTKRLAATATELNIANEQKVLLQTLNSVQTDDDRRVMMRKIQALEIKRLQTRLGGEADFAGDLAVKAAIPASDGTFRQKVAVMEAAQQYRSSVLEAQGNLTRTSACLRNVRP